MSPLVGEFIGTLLLLLLGDGAVANVLLARTKGHNAGWIVITFGFAMAVFVAVWCVGEISGAHLNPAVTIGLAAAGKFTGPVGGYVIAQFLGAMVGSTLVFLFYYDHFKATEDADAKLGVFCTAPAIRRTPTNLFCEIVGTFVLVFAALMAIDPSIEMGESKGKIGLGALGALPVGLLIFSIGLSLGGTTGYAINPARDLGPRFMHAVLPVPGKRDADWNYAWIPVVGPLLGGLLAAGAFAALSQTASPTM